MDSTHIEPHAGTLPYNPNVHEFKVKVKVRSAVYSHRFRKRIVDGLLPLLFENSTKVIMDST